MAAKSYRSSGGKVGTVDSTLFAKSGGTAPKPASVAIVSKSSHDTLQSILGESSMLTAQELKRMRDTASGEEGKRAAAAAAAAAKHGQMQKAQERKQKMLELEAQRKLAVPPSEVEQQKMREKAALLSASEKQMAEELDDVKKMNQMMLYSKVVTIRDAQLNEKKVMQKEKLEEERRLDTVMEVERLKALRMYEEREMRKKEDQRVGAEVIINQMKERERERVRQLELQDQEREAMLRQNEDLKNEELLQAQLKKEAGKKLLEEVSISNADQITLKKREKEKEKDEDRRIAAYLRDREMREQELAQEKERIKMEKERETARLRAMQEKMKDKQAELDALRAKRASEEAERQWRKSQQVEAERAAAIQASLDQARAAQKMEKERRLIEQAQQEKLEFDRILRVQREQEEQEKLLKYKKAQSANAHMEELQAQILMNAEVRKKNRMEFLAEGVGQRAKMENDRLKLETIKAEKLATLHSIGVPEKYTVDLASKKFS
ncbi:hypothetical protein AB1Y20_011796 [Prymnesium parvum]|uniref:Cilia- and flagella-associated protein 45 n=1 Tax=Prymnesium parvum TaxID=97485 RepID=A0AB34IJ60_PRYPA